MTPPTNDNPPPRKPGLFSTPKRAAENLFYIAVIAVIYGSAFLYLDARGWLSIGFALAIATACMIGGALYRLIVYGRA